MGGPDPGKLGTGPLLSIAARTLRRRGPLRGSGAAAILAALRSPSPFGASSIRGYTAMQGSHRVWWTSPREQAEVHPVVESHRAGAARLRTAFEASDLPDAAAALERPPKSVILEHRQHRARRVGKAPKAATGQPHHQVKHPVERPS